MRQFNYKLMGNELTTENTFIERHKETIVGGGMLLGFVPAHELIHALTALMSGGEVLGMRIFPSNELLGYTDINMKSLGTPEQVLCYLAPNIVLGTISCMVFTRISKTIMEPPQSTDEELGTLLQGSAAALSIPLCNYLLESTNGNRLGDLTQVSTILLNLANQYVPTVSNVLLATSIEKISSLVKKAIDSIRKRGLSTPPALPQP